MIDVAQAVDAALNCLAVVRRITARSSVDGFDRGEFAVGKAERPVGRAELDAVASCEGALFFAEDFDAEEPDRIVLDAPPVGGVDREQVGVAIKCFDAA